LGARSLRRVGGEIHDFAEVRLARLPVSLLHRLEAYAREGRDVVLVDSKDELVLFDRVGVSTGHRERLRELHATVDVVGVGAKLGRVQGDLAACRRRVYQGSATRPDPVA